MISNKHSKPLFSERDTIGGLIQVQVPSSIHNIDKQSDYVILHDLFGCIFLILAITYYSGLGGSGGRKLTYYTSF